MEQVFFQHTFLGLLRHDFQLFLGGQSLSFSQECFLFDVARRQSIEERWRRRRWAITVFDTASSWQDMVLTFYAIESFIIPSAEFWPVIL